MTATPDLLTLSQVAERLGVGVLTVRAWVRGDRCPIVKDGRRAADAGGWTSYWRRGGDNFMWYVVVLLLVMLYWWAWNDES